MNTRLTDAMVSSAAFGQAVTGIGQGLCGASQEALGLTLMGVARRFLGLRLRIRSRLGMFRAYGAI
jgi:hypothetical protein